MQTISLALVAEFNVIVNDKNGEDWGGSAELKLKFPKNSDFDETVEYCLRVSLKVVENLAIYNLHGSYSNFDPISAL